MIETVLETKHIFEGRIVKLDVHTVRLPSGNISKREVVWHNGGVGIVPIDDAGNIIMVRQFRLPAQQVLLEIPAGGRDGTEAPRDCAIRELQEEIGYKPNELIELGAFFVGAGYSSEEMHLYLSRRLEPSRLEPDDDESLEVVRMPFAEVLEMAYDGRLIDAKSIIAVMRAAPYLQNT